MQSKTSRDCSGIPVAAEPLWRRAEGYSEKHEIDEQ